MIAWAQGQQPAAWQMKSPLLLDVARVSVDNAYPPAKGKPHVEQLLARPPVALIQQWVSQRIRPAGSAGAPSGSARRALITVEQASITEVPLAVSGGIKGFFKTDQSERYDAVIRVRIAVLDEGGEQASARAEARRSHTVAEGTPDKERRDLWVQLANEALSDLDARLETEIRVYLGSFLR
ncbi:MAG: hypothetical protein R3E60_02430 [Alphaproteobacteria bacterium]